MATNVIRIRLETDYLALVGYRAALRSIVQLAEEEPWRDSDEAEIARAALDALPVSWDSRDGSE